jgi:hypothetical protein
MDRPTARNPHRARPSGCAAKSRNAELARLRRLSIEERIKAALTMSVRFAWLAPTPKDR